MNELQDVVARLTSLEAKADAIFRSAEKTRKYFKATLIVTVLTIVLPMIGMALIVPYYLRTIDLSQYGF